MTAAVLLTLVVVGLAVGLLAGLIGIGGGVLIVPFLYFFYAHPRLSGPAMSPDLATTVAHATSLAVIVPTAVRGTFAYHRNRLVEWRAALPIALAALVAATAGALLATWLPGSLLRLGFGLLLVGSGAQLLLRRSRHGERPLRLNPVVTLATGALVGLLSAMLGVGGGLIAIPMLIYIVGLRLEQVAATSLAVVAFAATAGVITYAATGWGADGLPAGSVGYIHLAAAIPILLGSLVSVRFGTVVNRRMDSTALRRLFGAVFILAGIYLVVEQLGALL